MQKGWRVSHFLRSAKYTDDSGFAGFYTGYTTITYIAILSITLNWDQPNALMIVGGWVLQWVNYTAILSITLNWNQPNTLMIVGWFYTALGKLQCNLEYSITTPYSDQPNTLVITGYLAVENAPGTLQWKRTPCTENTLIIACAAQALLQCYKHRCNEYNAKPYLPLIIVGDWQWYIHCKRLLRCGEEMRQMFIITIIIMITEIKPSLSESKASSPPA